MIWLLIFIVLIVCVTLPGLWVRQVMKKYSEPADRYKEHGNGGELARHILDRFDLGDVKVEETPDGDHYDPAARAVRLTPGNYTGYSLTAVTVAAHEVGHAIQDARGESLFRARQTLAKTAMVAERFAGILLIAAPIVFILTRAPQASILTILIGAMSMALGTVVHLVTLPVEFDASYRKALPILKEGDYLRDGDLQHAEKILKAAALTYVAGSLASLLNLGRWIAILRR
ncbi:MAG: zinc metallopeptidase [Halioglobus sp.]